MAQLIARLLCVAALLACGSTAVNGQDSPAALERRVKAAFLYKFAGYVEWPPGTFQGPDEPVTIGVVGDDQLASELAVLVAGRNVDGRPIAVRRVLLPELAAGVHIVYIARPDAPRIAQVTKALPPGPVLVVTESEGALNQGSMINLMVVDGRVKFEISMQAAERRGVRLSSRLLALAQNVRMGAPQ